MSDFTSPLGTPGSSPSSESPQRPLLMVGVVGGIIVLVLLCVAVVVVLVSRRSTSVAGRATPTPAPGTPVSGQIISPGPGGTVPLTLTAPSAIEFGDHKFEVLPVEVTKGAWPYQHGHPDKAVWVFGTLINYVVGLEASQDNTRLLESLKEGDLIELTTYGGKTFSFRYSGSQRVTVDQTDVFRQLRPGLTLVLLGEKDEKRLVVSASYVVENEPSPSGQVAAKVGTPVNVPGAQVTALGGKLVKDVAGLPAGNAYYLADFSVTRLGSGALDASLFQLELLDVSGKRYELSIQASLAGTYGPPGGQLLPNTTLTATAGFVVPEALPGTAVILTFSPQVGTQAPARFQLPIAGPPPTPDPRALVTVQVVGARYSDDATEVIVSGGIGNTSKEPLTVSLSDISLQAGGTLVPVKTTEPELPWTLQPGQNLAFTVHFVRPPAGTAIFKMMQSSFELGGLQ